ncbi:uncharacterized protein AAEQ78_026276 [Lycaon pictus]
MKAVSEIAAPTTTGLRFSRRPSADRDGELSEAPLTAPSHAQRSRRLVGRPCTLPSLRPKPFIARTWNCGFSVAKIIYSSRRSYATGALLMIRRGRGNPAITEQPCPRHTPRPAPRCFLREPGREEPRPRPHQEARGGVGRPASVRACVRAPAYAATAGRGARGHGGPAPGLGPAVPGGTGSIPDSRTAREPGRSPDPAARSAAPLRAPAGARGGTALPGTEPSAKPRSRRPVPKPTSSRRRPRLPWAPLAFSFTCAGPATGNSSRPGGNLLSRRSEVT